MSPVLPFSLKTLGNALTVGFEALQQGSCTRERPHLGQILLLIERTAVLLNTGSVLCHSILWEDRGDELIATLANLLPDLRHGNFIAEMPERFLPRFGVEIDRID